MVKQGDVRPVRFYSTTIDSASLRSGRGQAGLARGFGFSRCTSSSGLGAFGLDSFRNVSRFAFDRTGRVFRDLFARLLDSTDGAFDVALRGFIFASEKLLDSLHAGFDTLFNLFDKTHLKPH
jgi:hypothetical protein